jgi:hypothetical protein
MICRLGEEYLDKNLKPSFKSGHILVRVWSYYYGDKIGPLVIIKRGGRITAKRYLKTPKKHFILFYYQMVQKYSLGVVI